MDKWRSDDSTEESILPAFSSLRRLWPSRRGVKKRVTQTRRTKRQGRQERQEKLQPRRPRIHLSVPNRQFLWMVTNHALQAVPEEDHVPVDNQPQRQTT